MSNKFYLIPENGRKSFYRKVIVIEEKNENGDIISVLQSYVTTVARYNHTTNKMEVFGWYSMTTAYHINSFLVHFGFNKCNKKQLENYVQ